MLYKKSMKVLMLVVMVLALSGFTFAFAAANVVDPSKAGDGSGAITGYDVTNIHYVLNTTTPSTIDAVTFELNSPATAVRAKVGATWSPACTLTGSTWSCNISGTTVLSAATLQVVASN